MTDKELLEPVAAQVRFRRPEKSERNWSAWQPASIDKLRPSWEIDNCGWEVEYRLLYAIDPEPVAYALTMPDGIRLVHLTLKASHVAARRWAAAYEGCEHLPLYRAAAEIGKQKDAYRS